MTRIKNLPRWLNQKGQVLVMAALMFLLLLAFIGLAMDVGVVFVGYARLRRAVDSAALSAAGQIRKGYLPADLTNYAEEFLQLNNIDDPHATVEFCNLSINPSAPLCQPPYNPPLRKLVRVTASSTIPLNFMVVLPGFPDSVTVTANAISEAASLDVAIIIDTSESMNSDQANQFLPNGNPNPTYDEDLNTLKECFNEDPTGTDGFPGECHPFEEVKKAAYDFVDQLYFPYDRVSIVTFDQQVALRIALTDDKDKVKTTIKNLGMMGYSATGWNNYDKIWPPLCDEANLGSSLGFCLRENGATDGVAYCDPLNNVANTHLEARPDGADANLDGITDGIVDPTTCTNTNIGGGVEMAGSELATDARQESLWVIILLTDGAANAGISPSQMSFDPYKADGLTPGKLAWICPKDNVGEVGFDPNSWGPSPYCRDDDSDRNSPSSDAYDADDYARDMMDAATFKEVAGVRKQIAYMYTIGLGSQVTNGPGPQPNAGELLLKYGASTAVGQGEYSEAPDATKLREIFKKIAENIATRISH